MVSTYQDEGVVVTTFEDATGSHVQQVPFTLRFKQANFFRFEWISYLLSRSGTVNTVWCNGKESFTYLEPNAYEQYDDIGGAVAAATGVSSGSIHTIPRLLLPDKVMGSDLTEILEPAFSREEIIEGVLCYHIRGLLGAVPHDMWVGKEDLLVRKVRTERKYPNYVAIKDEIHRNIRVDKLIANEIFNFKLPIALKPQPNIGSLLRLRKGRRGTSVRQTDRQRLVLNSEISSRHLELRKPS